MEDTNVVFLAISADWKAQELAPATDEVPRIDCTDKQYLP